MAIIAVLKWSFEEQMLSILVIILIVIGAIVYFRRLRQREVEEFMGADMSLLEASSTKPSVEGVAETVTRSSIEAKREALSSLKDSNQHVSNQGATQLEHASLALADNFLDDTHGLLYRALIEVLGQQYYLAMYVPLSDLVETKDPLETEKLRSYRLGCLICNKETFHPITGIYMAKSILVESAESDLVKGIFARADIPLISLAKDESFSPADLKLKLAGVLDKSGDHKICSKCGEAMALRLVTKGKNAGNTFWVCKSYPRCKGVEKFSPLA